MRFSWPQFLYKFCLKYRNDATVRKVSILILGEMLKILTEKYLYVDDSFNSDKCSEDIHVSLREYWYIEYIILETYIFIGHLYETFGNLQMGLIELQYGIEKPQNIGMQLQKNQSYSLLIYVYFYCQSSEE